MIIKVRVTPNSKVELLKKVDDTNYLLKVRERALEGRANNAVIEAIASYFKVSRNAVSIIHGAKNREKFIRIEI